jgi:hypothetical protein
MFILTKNGTQKRKGELYDINENPNQIKEEQEVLSWIIQKNQLDP